MPLISRMTNSPFLRSFLFLFPFLFWFTLRFHSDFPFDSSLSSFFSQAKLQPPLPDSPLLPVSPWGLLVVLIFCFCSTLSI
ncbi:hypothetical protein BJX76DRAFT_337744 [Aspergillus varians]